MSTLNNPLFYAIPLISRAPWSPAAEVDPEKKEHFASKPSGCNMLTFVTNSFYLDVKGLYYIHDRAVETNVISFTVVT